MIGRLLVKILISRWVVAAEVALILLPTTGVALFSVFGAAALIAAPALGIVVLLSIVALISLWRLLISLFQAGNAPFWIFLGLAGGIIAAIRAIAFFPSSLLIYGPSLLLSLHWFWLYRNNINLSLTASRAAN